MAKEDGTTQYSTEQVEINNLSHSTTEICALNQLLQYW